MLRQPEPARAPTDPVNRPPHYTAGHIEPIDVIEDWNLGFCLGNTVKYIARAGHKGAELIDLKKAEWYLRRQIAALESASTTDPGLATGPHAEPSRST